MALLTFDYLCMDPMAKFQGLAYFRPGKKFIPPESHHGYYQDDKYAQKGSL